jgi:predicted MFS family arabinose efflux permease
MTRLRRGPLAHREFRLLFAGRLISFTGGAVSSIALAFAILDLTGSRSDLGIVLAAGTIPMILFLLVGGALADRLPRNGVMVGSNLVNAATQGTTAVLLLTHHARIWELVVLQLVSGTARAFFFPASQGIVPQTVPADLLQQANALLRIALNSTNIVGPAIGGLLVAGVGAGWAIAFDALSFVAAAAALRLMALESSERVAGSSFASEIVEGWREFSSRTWLWLVVIAFAFLNACWSGGVNVLGAAVAKFELGGAKSFGVIAGAESIGLVLGGFVMLRWRPNRLLYAGCAAMILQAPMLVLFAAVPHTLLIALAGVGAGFGVEIFGVCWDTAVQQHIPQRALSRVYAYDMLGSMAFVPVGLAVAGPLADAVGQDATLYGFAAVIVAGVIFMLASRDVRTMTRTA